MKIALLEPLGVPRDLIDALARPILEAGHEFIFYDTKTTDPEELKRRSQGCEVVMIANNPFPGEVVEACPELRLLNVAFTGIDHVGLDACRRHGITVCNAANYSNQTVAELVIGMTISLLRRLPECGAAVRSGGTSAGLCGREIAGRTVGIVGTGRIGTMVARLFQAFGARVIASSRTHREEVEALGVDYLPLEALMAQSDIVTIHTPNTSATRGLIGRDQIALMKPSAILINTARGPIVDSDALAAALNSGKLAGAGIDVFEVEPPVAADHPLLTAKNVIATPHVGFATVQAFQKRAVIVANNLAGFFGGNPINLV